MLIGVWSFARSQGLKNATNSSRAIHLVSLLYSLDFQLKLRHVYSVFEVCIDLEISDL